MPKPRSNKNKARKKATPTEISPPFPGDSSYPDVPKENESPLPSSQPPAKGEDKLHPASCIEHRWNGPRVLDVAAFVTSQHAAAPNMEDVNCAVYAAPEVREMILKVLPEENALILWYNKSRKSARICPACRRFYAVGDILLPHLIDDQSGSRAEYVDPRNLREKRISGLCLQGNAMLGSLMCFGIASYNWPGSIGAWGKCSSELDGRTQALLSGPGANIADDGMGAFMKVSRMENLLEVIADVYHAGLSLY